MSTILPIFAPDKIVSTVRYADHPRYVERRVVFTFFNTKSRLVSLLAIALVEAQFLLTSVSGILFELFKALRIPIPCPDIAVVWKLLMVVKRTRPILVPYFDLMLKSFSREEHVKDK